MQPRYICIHGHFYQPPRENPWLEEVEIQESAAPFHDWNQRITAECYAPNTASRILDQDKKILYIVNNYSQISFNFGPTLLSWLETHEPETYAQILQADKFSQKRFSGHGSALAQVFNHMIMPLADKKDKQNQVIWGIQDFQYRFQRFPEGMWLPETAVDTETLEVLAENGILFTILAQHQAAWIKPLAEDSWQDVQGGRIDPTRPYLCRLPSGREITLFFYDGPISQDIAFGGLLNSGESMAARLTGSFTQDRDWPQMVHVATDGETYGHHHHMGDMALAFSLFYIEAQDLARITIYGEYLEKHPPSWEVQIVENSSWSCAHGVKRWQEHCGCHSGMKPDWIQDWRYPLRQAMDLVRDELRPIFQEQASAYLTDPWLARDNYIQVILDRSRENVLDFLHRHSKRRLQPEEQSLVLTLLEMQRHSLLMYTSCGWFFDEISGIETTQVMRYAARAMQLAREMHPDSLQENYMQILQQAPSNKYASGRDVYEKFVQPAKVDFDFLGGHYALSSLFEPEPENIRVYCYTVQQKKFAKQQAGNLKLAAGCVRLISDITWQARDICFAAVYLGGHNAHCGLLQDMDTRAFDSMQQEIQNIFAKGDLPNLVRCMDKHFGTSNFNLWHLFKDEQQKVLQGILQSSLDEIRSSLRQILDQNYPLLNFLAQIQLPLPRELALTADSVINCELQQILQQDPAELDRLQQLIADARNWNIQLESTAIGFKAGWYVDFQMQKLQKSPDDIELMRHIQSLLLILQPLQLHLNLWKSQNTIFELARSMYAAKYKAAQSGDDQARVWLEMMQGLGEMLAVDIS